MSRVLSLALATVSLTACWEIENELVAQWEPSPLQRLGCDGSADEAASPEERPVAVCDATLTELSPIFDSTTFLGQDSYDPGGNEIVDWYWRLAEAPTGSSARLQGGIENRHGFTPDMAGEYVAELVVTNDQCVMSDPCRVAVQAVPAEDLWIEMHWTRAGDDMDLHLLEGSAAYESDGDCHFGNCTDGYSPDFGDRSSRADDPHLDLDDIDGKGPENINVYDPAQGLYRVVVHDYPGSVHQGANDVTVKIHLGGELVFEETRTITGEDKYVPFAEIEWPTKQVRGL